MKSFILMILIILSCAEKKTIEKRQSIEMVTTKGTITIDLYNETPLHRDNFIKLAKEAAFDSLLFHRVIQNFMIQGGDPDSKYAEADSSLGEGDKPYTVPAEFHPDLFHKKGVLAAARDNDPNRASSAMQFYIVQGKVFNDSTLDRAEKRINTWLSEFYTKNDPANKGFLSAYEEARKSENNGQNKLLNDSLRSMAKSYVNFDRYIIPEAHREVYKTIGGTPHLDQNYTVFGEVRSGLSVVDSIAAVQTNDQNRPIADVRILSVKLLK